MGKSNMAFLQRPCTLCNKQIQYGILVTPTCFCQGRIASAHDKSNPLFGGGCNTPRTLLAVGEDTNSGLRPLLKLIF